MPEFRIYFGQGLDPRIDGILDRGGLRLEPGEPFG
jgi:hypothetical protein